MRTDNIIPEEQPPAEVLKSLPPAPDTNQEQPETNAKNLNITAQLIEIGQSCGELFTDEDGNGYASFLEKDVYKTMPLSSKEFYLTLAGHFFELHGKPAKPEHIKDALDNLTWQARRGGLVERVFIRTAKKNGRYYIDTGDFNWSVIEISSEGWQITKQSPVKFIRPSSMRPLPLPQKGGRIDLLWNHLHIRKSDRTVILAFILSAMRHERGQPILEILGSHGTGKSWTTDVIRMLVDPNKSMRRSMPKSIDDMYVVAASNWVMTYENVSHIPNDMQDAMCTLATGGGYAKRSLYTDFDETVVDVCRPQIINGITPLISRQDLVDRAISIELPKITEDERKPEDEMLKQWDKDYPFILGALLDVFSSAMSELERINLKRLPRLATFGKFGEAVNIAAGLGGSFIDAFRENQIELVISALESSPVCMALKAMAAVKKDERSGLAFHGSFTELLNNLKQYRTDDNTGWPKSGRGLSDILKRQEAALMTVGVIIKFNTRGNGRITSLDVYHDSTTENS